MDILQGLFDHLWAFIFSLSGWHPGAALKNFIQWIVAVGGAVTIIYKTWNWLRGERPATKKDFSKLAQQPAGNGTAAYDTARALSEKLVEQSSLAARAEDRAATLEQQMQSKRQEIEALTRTIEEMKAGARADQPGMEEALAALQRGDTAKAETLFDRIAKTKIAEGSAANGEAARALINKGNILFLHDTQGAMRAYVMATELDPDEPEGWNGLGELQWRTGDLDDAIHSFERVLALGNGLSGQEWIAVAYGNLGLIYRLRGDLAQAEAMHKKSLAINEQLGRKEGMAADYNNLGVIHQTRGNLGQAKAMHKVSLSIAEQLGLQDVMANQYGNIGNICLMQDDPNQAEIMFKKSLTINEYLGRKEYVAIDYGNIGAVYQQLGNLDQAEAMHKSSLVINEQLGRKEGIADQLANLGVIYERRRDFDQAEAMSRQPG